MKVLRTDIEKRIVDISYLANYGASLTTIAVVKLDNGFEQVGTSACVDPDEFNADLGKKYAYDDAIDKLFPHFAFLLLEAKHQAKTTKTFGQALKALKEGKTVKRDALDARIKLVDGNLEIAFYGGAYSAEGLTLASILADDWTVL